MATYAALCRHPVPSRCCLCSVMLQAQQQLVHFQPRNLAQLIWATATLQVQPSSDFMSAYSAASGTQLPRFRAIDLANTLWGLARLEFQPSGLWLSAALAASARCWSQFKPSELSISIWALARLGVRFTCLGLQQQQEQQHQSVRPAAEAWASSLGLQESGFSWLLGSIALLSPAMGLQEIANLLWGLAVGRASMSRQEVQVCASGPMILSALAAVCCGRAVPPSAQWPVACNGTCGSPAFVFLSKSLSESCPPNPLLIPHPTLLLLSVLRLLATSCASSFTICVQLPSSPPHPDSTRLLLLGVRRLLLTSCASSYHSPCPIPALL
jgi:hypothetical protein